MYGLLLLVIFAFLVFRGTQVREEDVSGIPRKISDKMGRLWDIAHQGMRENRFLRAEKALLTILKIDQRNAAAYNRLGILYAKQKEYKDAIDCFEIASSIEPTASSLHNLGLIYYETENYQKAATAFEQALKLEEGLAARHIAYAKVQEKLGDTRLMLEELRRAIQLEPNSESFMLLIKAYQGLGMTAEADLLQDKLQRHSQSKSAQTKPKKVFRPKRVVI